MWVEARKQLGLQGVPAVPRAQRGAQAPLHRVLRRRPLRHPARRLRGGNEDVRGRGGLRPAQGGAAAAHRRGGGRPRSRTRSCARPSTIDQQRELERDHPRALRLRTRSTGASTRSCTPRGVLVRDDGHPDHDALRPTTGSSRSSRRCTSSATACTSNGSTRRSSARRSARGVSLGLHESQSRMWENLVGRSRPFWRWFYPRLQEAFPAARAVEVEVLPRRQQDRADVHPRRADQVTYSMHIILRFELEQEIVTGASRWRTCPRHGTRR